MSVHIYIYIYVCIYIYIYIYTHINTSISPLPRTPEPSPGVPLSAVVRGWHAPPREDTLQDALTICRCIHIISLSLYIYIYIYIYIHTHKQRETSNNNKATKTTSTPQDMLSHVLRSSSSPLSSPAASAHGGIWGEPLDFGLDEKETPME